MYGAEAKDITTQRDVSPTRRPLVGKLVKIDNINCDFFDMFCVINIRD